MRAARYLVPLALSGVLAIACGAQPGGPTGPSATEQLAQSAGQGENLKCDAGQEHWRASGTPKRGDVFRAAGAGPNLSIIEPGGSTQNARRLYDTLVKWRSCFYEDMTVVPSLAKSWEVSADGREWTLRLRDDVRWHNKPPLNGRLLTSADVAWTIDYQAEGGILRSYWKDVNHRQPDRSTVVLRLNEPDADFLPKLADAFNVVAPREVHEQFKDFKTVAVGTGPFMLKDFKPNDTVVLEANPDYYEVGLDGKPLPYLKEYHGIRFPDPATEVAAMRTGQLDLNTGAGFRRVEADLLKASVPKLRSYDPIGATIFGLFPNVKQKPFDDPRVRRAISFAIDRDDLIQGSLQGSAVNTGFVAAPLRDYAWPQDKMKEKFRPDREQAKRLLAEAGYGPGGLQFTLTTVNQYVPDAEVVQQQLQQIGVNAQIAVSPLSGSGAVLRAGGFEAVFGAITSPPVLVSYQAGEMVRTGGAGNFTGFSDPKVDALAAAQGRELDPVKRKQVVDQLQDYLYEVMPYIPVYTKRYHRLLACRVQNLPPIHFELYGPGPEYAWLDSSGC